MSSGPLIVLVFIWESPQRDEQGVVSLCKQDRFGWYQKVWCLPMINTQFRGFFTGMPLTCHSNKGDSVPDSAVSLNFSISRLVMFIIPVHQISQPVCCLFFAIAKMISDAPFYSKVISCTL